MGSVALAEPAHQRQSVDLAEGLQKIRKLLHVFCVHVERIGLFAK